jgi:hypothetical protein
MIHSLLVRDACHRVVHQRDPSPFGTLFSQKF